MEYVNYGKKTDMKVSRFGLGCMRFPQEEKDAIAMVRRAIDNGVNYIDTAYVYGSSEEITGKALKDGYRNKTYLATKNPTWLAEKHEDLEKNLDVELERLGVDYIDVYLLHNLDPNNWKKVRELDAFTFLDKMIEKGKIRYPAFSMHNDFAAFKEVVDYYDKFVMGQIQMNILDEHNQVTVEGLKYGAEKGLAMVIMEPLRGGHLLTDTPKAVIELVNNYPEKRSLVEWCFRWLYNMPEVTLVLSGTSTNEQLDENLRIFNEAKTNVMSDSDMEFIKKLQEAYAPKDRIGCTGCRYCMPCPQGVSIPDIFALYNKYQLEKPSIELKQQYKTDFIEKDSDASQCIECGNCQSHCPQALPIIELLKTANGELL